MGDKTTRREFLKQMAFTGVAVTGLSGVASAAEKVLKGADNGKARVVIATDRTALKGDGVIVQSVIDQMVDRSVTKLTNAANAAQGWKSLFSPSDIVGIKVNTLFAGGTSTHMEVVNSIIRGLKSAGVKEDNIIIWDRSTSDLIKCGFQPNKDGKGVKCYGDDGDWGETIKQGSFNGRITKVISQKVTAFINVPILKTHGLAGISCCLKNHYGSFDNPGKHHDNNCNPALADFSSIPVVKNKTRLVIVDALRPQYDGGPGSKPDVQFNNYAILASTDPVATDAVGLQIIQKSRVKAGLNPIAAEATAWLKSAQDRNVGICDMDRIDVLNA